MALVIEDGTGADPTANSYATVDEIKAYLTARGRTPPDDGTIEGLAVRAMDYIEAQEDRFAGERTSPLQPLSWPRADVILYGADLEDNFIPVQLKNAQAQLCFDADDVELMPTLAGSSGAAGGAIIEETVGPLTTKYSTAVAATSVKPTLSAADAILRVLFRNRPFLTSRRV
jgi:hypothetical protein